jgi:hypothetical protein
LRKISVVDHEEGEASGIPESEFRKVRKLSVVDFCELQNPEERKEKFLKGLGTIFVGPQLGFEVSTLKR